MSGGQVQSNCHFTYSEHPDNASLMQGDVLRRTPEIDRLLEEVHPHFFRKPANKYFMVVTQSCDLVPGRKGTSCKAPHIAIAPVRPLSEVVTKQVAALAEGDLKSELPLLSSKAKSNLSMFLGRLYNNNEPGYFFLESTGTKLVEDCCAILSLTIAVKSSVHYETCLKAKVLELDQAFQAKLGWLVGQLYSRVGTTDWDAADLNQKVKAALKDAAIWVPEDKMKAVLSRLAEGDTDGSVTSKKVEEVINSIPSQKDKVINHLVGMISDAVPADRSDISAKILRRIRNDAVLSGLLNKY